MDLVIEAGGGRYPRGPSSWFSNESRPAPKRQLKMDRRSHYDLQRRSIEKGEATMHAPSGKHPVDHLFSRLQDLDYPDGLVAVPKMMRGTAFFPGGYGVWREVGGHLPPMPLGEVMVLGQDFGKKKDYKKALSIGHELDTSRTWRHLCPLLRDACIAPECCFFTNAYMGLRTGGSSMGPSPGTKHQGFREWCESFLREQLSEQKPRLILVLGLEAAGLIASVSHDLDAWSKRGHLEWRDLYAAGRLKRGVDFGDAATGVTVVALLHPSGYDLGNNLRHRRYGKNTGRDAELALLRKAAT